MTAVDRATRCLVGWSVVWERSVAAAQKLIDQAPRPQCYYSDHFPVYQAMDFHPSRHLPVWDKSQTYSVEGVNADLRHYLGRLRRRSRCFSRCIQALRRAIKLFAYYYNQRQLQRHHHPNYPAHIIDFVSMPI